jgi:hypothetical protein
MLDFNHTRNEEATVVSEVVNDLVAAAPRPSSPPRSYLGASSIGHECARRVQLDWIRPQPFDAKTLRIFARGHWGERIAREELEKAGFSIWTDEKLCSFSQANGRFQGHIDGRIEDGPAIAGLGYPCLWECKTLGKKGWTELGRKGLRAAYPAYYSQVQLYMVYCELYEWPCLFTALCADTMDFIHLLVPFDPAEAQRASDRAVTVLRAVEAKELLPPISSDPSFWLCKWCSHRSFCHAGL